MLLIASGAPLPLYPAAPECPPEDPPFISTICSKIRFKLKPLDTILFDALVDILISPFLFPDDRRDLAKMAPTDLKYFSKVLLEHMTTKMAENSKRQSAYYALYRKKMDNYI